MCGHKQKINDGFQRIAINLSSQHHDVGDNGTLHDCIKEVACTKFSELTMIQFYKEAYQQV